MLGVNKDLDMLSEDELKLYISIFIPVMPVIDNEKGKEVSKDCLFIGTTVLSFEVKSNQAFVDGVLLADKIKQDSSVLSKIISSKMKEKNKTFKSILIEATNNSNKNSQTIARLDLN